MVRLIIKVFAPWLVVMLFGCSSVYIIPRYSSAIPEKSTPLKIAVIGDLQRTSFLETWRERNDRQRILQVHRLARSRPDLVVTLGDNVFWGSSNDDWAYLDRVLAPLRKNNIPIMPVLGNHEYFGNIGDMLSQIKERFPLFEDPWYYRVVDSIAIIMINTNFRELGGKVMAKQRSWYVQTIRKLDAADSVKFIVVCGHHPPFTNSLIVEDDEILQSYFLPSFMMSFKGAIWFSGHCHAYERFVKQGKYFVVSGGGGGPRQRLATGIFSQHEDSYDGGSLRPIHYCTISRGENCLELEMVPLQFGDTTTADTICITTRPR